MLQTEPDFDCCCTHVDLSRFFSLSFSFPPAFVCVRRHLASSQRLFQRYIAPCIDYITEGLDDARKQTPLNTVIHQTSLNMLTQFCHVFDAVYPVSPIPIIEELDEAIDDIASASSVTNVAGAAAAVAAAANDDASTSATTTALHQQKQHVRDLIECGFVEVSIFFHWENNLRLIIIIFFIHEMIFIATHICFIKIFLCFIMNNIAFCWNNEFL